jgi:hypothetical protein
MKNELQLWGDIVRPCDLKNQDSQRENVVCKKY